MIFVFGLLFFLYNLVFQYKLGQTPGMMIVGMHLVNSGAIMDAQNELTGSNVADSVVNDVANAVETGSVINSNIKKIVNVMPTFSQVFLRNVIYIPMFPLFLFLIADPIYLLFKKERFTDSILRISVIEQMSLH
jgi:hypothetical protein